MTHEERKAMFEKANEQRAMQKEEEGRKGSFTYDEIKWSPLLQDAYKVYRLLGNPIDMRDGDRFSPQLINQSKIVGDNGKQMKVNWPSLKVNDGWILWRIFDKVMAYDWDKLTNSRKYHNQTKHPEIFNRVFKNGRPENTFEKGWNPSKLVLINAIDRDMMDWHRENKKTCLISKKVSESDGTFYYDEGIPLTLYNDSIYDEIVACSGDWQDYDILIRKYDAKPWYKVYHAIDDRKKFQQELKLVKGTLDFAGTPLTEEELSWERWNIDKYSKITTYTKIYNRLKIFIQQVDATFKTKFFEELERLVEKEKIEFEKNKSNEDESEDADATETSPVVQEKPVAEIPAKRVVSEKIDWATLEEKGFKGISKLTPEEKNSIISFDGEKFGYDPKRGPPYACTNTEGGCSFGSPESFTTCPKCGQSLVAS